MGLKHKEYYKINSKKIGLWYVEYCKNNKERLHTIAKTYKTTIKGRHTYLRQRLKKENIPQTDLLWSLNFYTEIIRDLTCHYCGGILNPFGHALDCADAGKGHVCYNVVPCCRSCNTKKMNDTSYEEMMLLAPVLREIRLRREARQEI